MFDIDAVHLSPEVASLFRTEKETKVSILHGDRRLDGDGIFLPLLATHFDFLVGELLMFAHCVVIDELNLEYTLSSFRHASPEREAIGSVFLNRDAEEAFVLDTGALVRVTRVSETHVMRVLVERTILENFKLTEGCPSHQTLWELERAVLDHLCIETAIGSKVDILKEDTIHG